MSITRDSASVNGNACRRMGGNPFTNSLQLMCASHTLNNAGDHAHLPTLKEWMTQWLELVGGRDPHRGAQSLWKASVAPAVVPGYSKTRWYSKAEISFTIAENFHVLDDFMNELDELEYGDATRKKMRAMLDDSSVRDQLQLELAGLLDVRCLVKETCALEGDRLEILLVYRRIQSLRQLGESIKNYDDCCLPNVQALSRSWMKLEVGVEISKDFPPHGCFPGFIVSSSVVESTLYPGTEARAYKVRYPSDGEKEDLEEDELRPLLKTHHLPQFQELCDNLHNVFQYIEDRFTGQCRDIYSCKEMYTACRLFQAFDPSFAVNLKVEWVDELCNLPLLSDLSKAKLKQQLPAYKALAGDWQVSHDDVKEFSTKVLSFWKRATSHFTEWTEAARIVFACSPNSAACERVFSLLNTMFGAERDTALADMVQA